MKCRECGTEIADKALICFRCGASVQEAVPQTVSRAEEKASPDRLRDLRVTRVDRDRDGAVRGVSSFQILDFRF